MKILIVGLAKIKYMPYLHFYLDSLNVVENDIHVAFWNRDGKPEDLSGLGNIIVHEFVYEQFNSVKKIFKLRPFFKYRRFVNKLCKKEKYDFIIFLHSLAGLVVKKYLRRDKYILDYRDTSLESYPFYKRLLKKWTQQSFATFVSSEGFLKYIPKGPNVYISHNLMLESLNHCSIKKTQSQKIRIAFWGYIRNVDVNLHIVDSVSRDKRFELHYYGREQADALRIKKYCQDNHIDNVFFHGEYIPSDRYSFAQNTDLLHNIYNDKNMMIAMGNKYYDGIIFKIPQLCFVDSFMGKQVTTKGVGIEVNPYLDCFLENVFAYYSTLNWEAFIDNADKELKRVLKEYKESSKLLESI